MEPGEQVLKKSWKAIEVVLNHEHLSYVPEVIQIELINRYHDKPLVGHFGIIKTWELVARKYCWPILSTDVESYVKDWDVC